MKGTILLNHNEDFRHVEDEGKLRFLRDLLLQMGVPISDFWMTDVPILTVDQRIKLRGVLSTFGVQVIDDLDGHMQVYFVDRDGDTLVGEWFKSSYKLKRDLKQRDPKKQLYLEMEVNCWS